MNFPFNAPPPGAFHPRIWKPLYSCGVNSAKPTGKSALQVLLAFKGTAGPRQLTASHKHTALAFAIFTASPDYATLKRIYTVR